MSSLFDLTGKDAVIAGSTKGIGKAIAEEFAKAGARVVISSRKAEACEKVAGALQAQGFEALAIPSHVGGKAQLQSLLDSTRSTWGTIGIRGSKAATNPG